jgi:hypothetical protein
VAEPAEAEDRTFHLRRLDGAAHQDGRHQIDSERPSADQLYKEEVDALRSSGCRLCEYTRLALDHEAISKHVLAGLFHTAWMFTYYLRNCDFAVIEVNPRHAAFYRRALMFEPIGQERFNTRVSAPAVLLCLQNDRFPPEIKKFGGRPELAKTTRLMFPHWFGEERPRNSRPTPQAR